MKRLLFISLLFFCSGCGGTLKNSWTNFRAYYNSYYNAEKNYATGLDKVKSQPAEIDAGSPIRVHPHPLQAGGPDFQKAIDKGADILRKFPESKWIDETLQLIGKSYYYRQEYYSALQKFEEMYRVTDNPVMRQKAVIWKGRVLLDLGQNEQGVAFLQDELARLDGEWQREFRGEVRVLLAEHFVSLQEWAEVESMLLKALPDLDKDPMKARTYFLLGQIMETRQRYGEASFAYSRCAENRPDFELLFWANLKQAESLRNMDNFKSATLIYERMRRDDKNVQRLPEILYELARTEEEQGDFETAEQSYKGILRSQTTTIPQRVRANIYYRLGEIYSRQYKQFQTAAVYYDSSATFGGSGTRTVSDPQGTETLARAYGTYAELKTSIGRLDSLLWLGSLPEARFDSVISEIQNRRLLELQNSGRRAANDALAVNITGDSRAGRGMSQVGDGSSSGIYGFMNYRNSRLLAEAVRQFRAVWGDRRLADNWRRIEAVRSMPGQETAEGRQDRRGGITDSSTGEIGTVIVDVSEVPFTEPEKVAVRGELAVAKYELGSLFFLTLEEPDSAANYFRAVIDDHARHPLVPKAMYSLREVHVSLNRPEEARRLAERLRREFPNSVYTRQLNEQLGTPGLNGTGSGSENNHADIVLRASALRDSLGNTGRIARGLRRLALSDREAPAAPQVHFEAIRYYIRLAKEKESVTGADTTVSGRGDNYRPSVYTYGGIYWDSVRVVLNEHRSYFPGSASTGEKVDRLLDELGKSSRESGGLPGCEDLGITPEIRAGKEGFLATVGLPEGPGSGEAAGSIEYEMVIDRTGGVTAFHLLSRKASTGLEEAFNRAIENNLEFLPLEVPVDVAKVRCRISFPVRR